MKIYYPLYAVDGLRTSKLNMLLELTSGINCWAVAIREQIPTYSK